MISDHSTLKEISGRRVSAVKNSSISHTKKLLYQNTNGLSNTKTQVSLALFMK